MHIGQGELSGLRSEQVHPPCFLASPQVHRLAPHSGYAPTVLVNIAAPQTAAAIFAIKVNDPRNRPRCALLDSGQVAAEKNGDVGRPWRFGDRFNCGGNYESQRLQALRRRTRKLPAMARCNLLVGRPSGRAVRGDGGRQA